MYRFIMHGKKKGDPQKKEGRLSIRVYTIVVRLLQIVG